jgi:hypothetical protein
MPSKDKASKVSKDQVPYKFSDHVTEEKIKKHLNDIHDVISEEDIKNVKIPGEETSKGSAPTPDLPKKDKTPSRKKKKEEPNEDSPISPWDLLIE